MCPSLLAPVPVVPVVPVVTWSARLRGAPLSSNPRPSEPFLTPPPTLETPPPIPPSTFRSTLSRARGEPAQSLLFTPFHASPPCTIQTHTNMVAIAIIFFRNVPMLNICVLAHDHMHARLNSCLHACLLCMLACFCMHTGLTKAGGGF